MTIEEYYTKNPDAWCKHSILNTKGQRCLVGAMMYCYPNGWDDARKKLKIAIRDENYGTDLDGSQSLIAFNDRDGRTFERVLKVVKAAGV